MSCAKTAETIKLTFGMRIWVGHVLDGAQIQTEAIFTGKVASPGHARMSSSQYTQSESAGGSTSTVWMPIGCTRWDAHWRHLANTSVCGGDVTLCQIMLTMHFYINEKHPVYPNLQTWRAIITRPLNQPTKTMHTV